MLLWRKRITESLQRQSELLGFFQWTSLNSSPVQEFPAAHWSSPFRSFWGMGFGKLGHNLLRGYSLNTENFTQVSRFFRWNDRAREVAGSSFTTSATTTLTASRDFFPTRGKGFFQRTCSIDDRHNQQQQDDIHRWPPTPESRSFNVFCQSTVALCSQVFWWKARWCAMPMVYQLYKLSV